MASKLFLQSMSKTKTFDDLAPEDDEDTVVVEYGVTKQSDRQTSTRGVLKSESCSASDDAPCGGGGDDDDDDEDNDDDNDDDGGGGGGQRRGRRCMPTGRVSRYYRSHTPQMVCVYVCVRCVRCVEATFSGVVVDPVSRRSDLTD